MRRPIAIADPPWLTVTPTAADHNRPVKPRRPTKYFNGLLSGFETDTPEFTARILECVISKPQGDADALREYRCELVGSVPSKAGHSISGKLHLITTTGTSVGPINFDWAHASRIQVFPERVQIPHENGPQAGEIAGEVTVMWNDPDSEPDWNRFALGPLPDGITAIWLAGKLPHQRRIRITVEGSFDRDGQLIVRDTSDDSACIAIPLMIRLR